MLLHGLTQQPEDREDLRTALTEWSSKKKSGNTVYIYANILGSYDWLYCAKKTVEIRLEGNSLATSKIVFR